MVDKERVAIGNEHEDWEVAVDTGEFDKRLEQQEKDRAVTQESTSLTINDTDIERFSNRNLITSNQPIRILKRPVNQSQLSGSNDITNSNTTIVTNNTDKNVSSFITTPIISITARIQTNEANNSSQLPLSLSSQSTKPAIKTYEQRELEYRLARLRIMGEEESSTTDDVNDNFAIGSVSITLDESITCIKTSNKTTNSSQSSRQNNSTSNGDTFDLCTVNNTGAIHFTPYINGTESLPHHRYHDIYSVPYSQMLLAPSIRYPTGTVYMSSPSSSPTSYHYQQQQQQQSLYQTQQFGQPQ